MQLTSPFSSQLYLLKNQTGQFASVTDLNSSGLFLYQLTTGSSGTLRALISSSVAGVTGVNSITGGVNIIGAGNITVTSNGQTITVSGANTGTANVNLSGYITTGQADIRYLTVFKNNEGGLYNVSVQTGDLLSLVISGAPFIFSGTHNDPRLLIQNHRIVYFGDIDEIAPNTGYKDIISFTAGTISTGYYSADGLSSAIENFNWKSRNLRENWNVGIVNFSNQLSIVNVSGLSGVSGILSTNIAATGQQAWLAANNNGINLSGNLGLTGSNLYILVTGLSGSNDVKFYLASNPQQYAPYGFVTGASGVLRTSIDNTGQQAWSAANNNGINLSGNLALTGSNLYIIITGFSGSSNQKFYLASNPQEYAPSGYVTGISGALRSLISASSAGVSSINGLSGILSIVGTGNVTIVNNGQTIIVSGTGGGGSVSNPEKRIAIFDPKEYIPPTANYATLDTLTYLPVLNFDEVIEQSAIWSDIIPKTATVSNGLEAKILWTGDSTSGSVRWKFAFGKGLATGFALPSGVTSNIINSNGVSPHAYITLTGLDGVATGDFYRLQVSRDVADGADTLTGYAKLVKVELSYI